MSPCLNNTLQLSNILAFVDVPSHDVFILFTTMNLEVDFLALHYYRYRYFAEQMETQKDHS